MSILHVTLLGRFEALWKGQPVEGFEHAKARELFCYLLLHRDKPNCRELIANNLWGGHYTTEVSKKYLRKALWQLHECLIHCSPEIQRELIIADARWLELSSLDSLWLDVAFVDDAYAAVKGVAGEALDREMANVLSAVAGLFQGELLEGQYQEWSLYYLVRYRQVILILLDKLMDYYLAHGEYESVLAYGEQVLRSDPAREFTHLKLMRAYYSLGDRTSAIRQFDRCREALHEELDVEPSRDAVALCEQIRADRVVEMSLIAGGESVSRSGVEEGQTARFALIVAAPSLTKEQQYRSRRIVGG